MKYINPKKQNVLAQIGGRHSDVLHVRSGCEKTLSSPRRVPFLAHSACTLRAIAHAAFRAWSVRAHIHMLQIVGFAGAPAPAHAPPTVRPVRAQGLSGSATAIMEHVIGMLREAWIWRNHLRLAADITQARCRLQQTCLVESGGHHLSSGNWLAVLVAFGQGTLCRPHAFLFLQGRGTPLAGHTKPSNNSQAPAAQTERQANCRGYTQSRSGAIKACCCLGC